MATSRAALQLPPHRKQGMQNNEVAGGAAAAPAAAVAYGLRSKQYSKQHLKFT